MKKKSIEFLKMFLVRGPNIWTYGPVLETWIDIGELEESPSNLIPGFTDRLMEFLPSLIEHRCSIGERGGFLQRLQTGTWPGHVMEHVTLELQELAGLPAGFGRARELGDRYGCYKVVISAPHEDLARYAIHAGRDLVMAAIEGAPFDVAGTVAKLRDMGERLLLGPSTAHIVEAATERKPRIPSIRLSDGNLVQLGYGARQRRIWTAETDATPAIAESISRDKDLTKFLLQSCGVPVPEGRLVTSPDDAWEAAGDIGLPVVVKPSDGNHGRGVFTNLTTRKEIDEAFAAAAEEGSGVIVERFIRGAEHRVLVVGGKVVAAARGDTASVTGDGRSTIRELVDAQINSDPLRGEEEEFPLDTIRVDTNLSAKLELARQGLTADSVPEAGREVAVVRTGNVAIDVTDRIHPDVAEMAELAAKIVGLDIAGIDLVAEDIGRPMDAQRAAIVEVNAGPGLLMHIRPAQGTPRPVGKAIVGHLFPEGSSNPDGRIPVVGVTGTRGTTVVAHLVARLLALDGKRTGLACADGVFINRREVEPAERADWNAAQRVLMNRAVDAAVIENTGPAILADGTAYDRCEVGIVTGIDPDVDLSAHYIDDRDKLFSVYRTQIDLVLPGGAAVLNADDPMAVEFAELSDGQVIYFAESGESPVVVAHREKGGRAVFVQDGTIVLANGKEVPVARIAKIPFLAARGQGAGRSESVLAAVAAAWALGIAPELIKAGVKAFELDAALAPSD